MANEFNEHFIIWQTPGWAILKGYRRPTLDCSETIILLKLAPVRCITRTLNERPSRDGNMSTPSRRLIPTDRKMRSRFGRLGPVMTVKTSFFGSSVPANGKKVPVFGSSVPADCSTRHLSLHSRVLILGWSEVTSEWFRKMTRTSGRIATATAFMCCRSNRIARRLMISGRYSLWWHVGS